MFFLWPLSKVLLDIKSRRLTTTVPVGGRESVRAQAQWVGSVVYWFWGVGLKLIALWLATLCKIGRMQCSELLKEFRNSFCFLPAALDFEQLFFYSLIFCAHGKVLRTFTQFCILYALRWVLAARPLPCCPPFYFPRPLSFLTPHCFMHF